MNDFFRRLLTRPSIGKYLFHKRKYNDVCLLSESERKTELQQEREKESIGQRQRERESNKKKSPDSMQKEWAWTVHTAAKHIIT